MPLILVSSHKYGISRSYAQVNDTLSASFIPMHTHTFFGLNVEYMQYEFTTDEYLMEVYISK